MTEGRDQDRPGDRPRGSSAGRPTGPGRPGGRGKGQRGGGGGRGPQGPRNTRDRDDRPSGGGRRKTITAGTGQLPRWVREEVMRATAKERREPALAELETGLLAYSEERFGKAAGALRRAKDLAPRAATVRELLGLATYQLEQWQEALSELRTFRRLTGITDHMAIEIDCQRALGKAEGVEKTWELFNELGGSREAEDEVRVVYASFLLERGERERAWSAIKPGRLVANPTESLLRRWAVAARVAAANKDRDTARKLVLAIRDADPDIPWLSEYDDLLA